MSARCVWLLALLVLMVAVAAAGAQPAAIQVEWTDDRLTVRADSAPLPDVLDAVARETAIAIFGKENLERTAVSISFSGVTLSDGLRRILTGQNYVLIEESSPRVGVTPVAVALGKWRGADIRTETAIDETPTIVWSLADRDPAIRAWAIASLSGRSDPETLARLLEALDDAHPKVREAALDALAPFGPAAVEAVTGLVRREAAADVRAAAVRVLGQMARQDAPPLLGGMLADPDAQVRIAAVEAAGHAEGGLGRETLVKATRDSEPGVRMAALRTLAFYVRDDDARAMLRQALADPDETVRAVAKGLLEVSRD